jgi:hypothetical protein
MNTLNKYSLFWILVISAAVVGGGRGFMNPGGTFISFTGTILPATLFLGCAFVPFVRYHQSPLGLRLLALIHSGIALALLFLLIVWTWGLFMEPYNRGYLFGW